MTRHFIASLERPPIVSVICFRQLVGHRHRRGDLAVGGVVRAPQRGHRLGLGVEADALRDEKYFNLKHIL